MGFKDELQKVVDKKNNAENEKKAADEARSKEKIPEGDLKALAQDIATRFKNKLREEVNGKKITYDYHKLFKSMKVNYRYQVGKRFSYHPVVPTKRDFPDYYENEELLPFSEYYSVYNSSEWKPTDIEVTPLNLEQIMNAVKELLAEDEVTFTWVKTPIIYGSDDFYLDITAYIRCDSSGNVI